MIVPLRVLIIEESSTDAVLLLCELRKYGYEPYFIRVDNAHELRDALQNYHWDLILSDYGIPNLSGIDALAIVKEINSDIPFILISESIGEELAIKAMKAGANDYIMKNSLARLVPAIERELREAKIHAAKKQIEVERVALIQQLQEALKARDEFLLIAAHELRTPITSLKLYLHLMDRVAQKAISKEEQETKQKELYTELSEQVEKLAQLVETFLDVSRISMGHLFLKYEQVDLSKIIQKVVDELNPPLTQANCKVEVDVDSPIIGKWDSDRISQIVFQLIVNASKHARESSIKVSASLQGNNAKLIVQDFGPGIPKHDHHRIFQRFERASSINHVGGLGLGLYIIKQIVQGHGGTITIDSEPGSGTTFTVELPIQPPYKIDKLSA